MGRFVCILACFWGVFLVSMMVVTLTVVSTFDRKESRAYAILFRLNIKQGIRKKAVFVITLAIRKAGLKKKFQKGKIDKAQFIRDNILLKSKLSVHLQYFLDEAAKISAYEISSEESLRQMTEKIDRDLDEVKEVLLSMIEIEKQLNEIQESQLIVANAMNQCINFTNNLEDHLNDFKENIVRKIKIIQKLKENQGELIPDYFKKKKKSKTRSPETDIKRKSSKENFLRKNLNIKEGELIQLD